MLRCNKQAIFVDSLAALSDKAAPPTQRRVPQ
jgi:hypothetical protein